MRYKVQFGTEQPEEECDEGTLFQWVEEGRLQANHRIWDENSNVWILAKDYPLLSNMFAQSLWDAWAVEDDWELDPSIETGIRKRMEITSKQVDVEESSPQKESYKTIPLSAIKPLEGKPQDSIIKGTSPPLKREKLESKSNPIRTTLPKFEPQKKSLEEVWQPDIPLRDQPQLWFKEEKKRNFSVLRIGILVLPILFVFFAVRWYIVSEASAIFPLETDFDRVPNDNTEDVLRLLENQIRSSLHPDTQIVSPTSSFADALRIDLEYAKIDIEYIDATVLSWKGRMLQDPREVELRIAINSNGEADREIAIVSMIVAKYVERYLMEMNGFTLVFHLEDGAFQKKITAKDARGLLLQPGSLEKFLNTVMK